MLHRYALAVVVEGHHDKVVLEAMLGEELEERRALVFPANGTQNIARSVYSQLFIDFTDLPVLIVVDNAEASVISALVARGIEMGPDDPSLFREAVRQVQLSKASEETKSLKTLIARAYEVGVLDRIHVHSLREPDVTEYFPPEAFVATSESWEQLRAIHDRAVEKDFKSWLTKARGASFSDERLKSAVGRLDCVPEDFWLLLDLIDRMTGRLVI